ncbi:hypothetical protein [Microbacterium esteraromaticum]|nr:hypothetical protein [Microbacterium esteraromaticum]
MSTTTRITLLAALSLIGMLGLSGCAQAPGASAPTSGTSPRTALASAAPPEAEVVGGGTVMDTGGSVELCLGAVAESYPPQCSGVPLVGWSWTGVEGSESSGETRWGAYAVTGRYDGETFTVTRPAMLLALYDPMAPEDPTGGSPDGTSEARLVDIQERLPHLLGGAAPLGSFSERGRLWVDVLWDDGSLQRAVDAEFGEDVVVIRSAFRPVDG